ncbi:MAG: hypothetical protein MJY87_00560 [Fibrobacter sp.]|nr:hypothetical protein [Fibrobacter sp.]
MNSINFFSTVIVGCFFLFATSFAGEFVDERDGHTYKTVTIGNQVWMAENLNYDCRGCTTLISPGNFRPTGVFCYKNSEANCKKYGRLYDWHRATSGICPSGWRLPNPRDWEILIKYVVRNNPVPKKKKGFFDRLGDAILGEDNVVGEKLKSSQGWLKNGNGSDLYGFSVLSGGYAEGWGYTGLGEEARFWTTDYYEWTNSDGYRTQNSTYMGFSANSTDAGLRSTGHLEAEFSVRCIKY